MNDNFRQRYLDYLSEEVSFDGGKTTQTRARNPNKWKQIPIMIPKISLQDRNVWVWSDLHFGHDNVIGYSDRPFDNSQTMQDHLIANFNEYVQPEDVSIWVGDIAFMPDTQANELLKQCNGYKIQIIGNHDFNKKKLKQLAFDEVHLLYVYEADGLNLLFTHYPLPVPKPWFNVHGHEHIHTNKTSFFGRSLQHINVNCELHHYKPLPFTTIKEWAHRRFDSME